MANFGDKLVFLRFGVGRACPRLARKISIFHFGTLAWISSHFHDSLVPRCRAKGLGLRLTQQ
jgi:hypothetical protein